MGGNVVHFEDGGAENTAATFRLFRERISHQKIKKIVLAFITGATARKAMDFFNDQGIKLT